MDNSNWLQIGYLIALISFLSSLALRLVPTANEWVSVLIFVGGCSL